MLWKQLVAAKRGATVIPLKTKAAKVLDMPHYVMTSLHLASAGKVEAASRKWQPIWVGSKWQPIWVGSSVPGANDHSRPSRLTVSGAFVLRVAKSSGHTLMP